MVGCHKGYNLLIPAGTVEVELIMLFILINAYEMFPFLKVTLLIINLMQSPEKYAGLFVIIHDNWIHGRSSYQ